MFCFRKTTEVRSVKPEVEGARVRRLALGVRRSLSDDRGVAALEGMLVFLLLAAVLLGVMLLGQWGTHLQTAQLGARLLAFDAGDTALAKLGKPRNQPSQQFSSESWDTLAGTLPAGWLNAMFVLPDDHYSGSVTGAARGRLAGQGSSLFDFSPASLGYHSGSSAASNPWTDSGPAVQSTFLGIAYYVGFNQETPAALQSIPEIPPAIPIAESIYARAGVR